MPVNISNFFPLNLASHDDDETYVYFFKQPEGPEENTAAENALAICPQNSIGNDG